MFGLSVKYIDILFGCGYISARMSVYSSPIVGNIFCIVIMKWEEEARLFTSCWAFLSRLTLFLPDRQHILLKSESVVGLEARICMWWRGVFTVGLPLMCRVFHTNVAIFPIERQCILCNCACNTQVAKVFTSYRASNCLAFR